ncbi:MAG: NAD-dependent epimerase/dehydratase family protein [Notoacmeibacter sp.]
MNSKSAIVIGGNGAFGMAVAQALVAKNWQVTGFMRRAKPSSFYHQIVEGDAKNAGDVKAACASQNLIIYAVNPPYQKWASEALAMLQVTIAAAKSSGATILFPGNIYNFGPDAGEVFLEDSPQNPVTRKGKIRVEMERALAQAAHEGVNTIVLRMGDFFGPGVSSSWFDAGLFGGKPGIPKSIAYPGDVSIGHTWAYLPDVGEAAARLIDNHSAKGFETYNFAGHFNVSGRELADAINVSMLEKTGKKLPIKSFAWGFLQFVRPFMPMVNELFEMRYLWDFPHRMNGSKLEAVFGAVPQTPLTEAVRATLGQRFQK